MFSRSEDGCAGGCVRCGGAAGFTRGARGAELLSGEAAPAGGDMKRVGFTPGALWHMLQGKRLELASEEGQCSEVSGGRGLHPFPLQEPFGHGPSWAGGAWAAFGCVTRRQIGK